MDKPQILDWQLPYKKNIMRYAELAGIPAAEKFSAKETEKILVQIINEYRDGKLPLDELAMTCEVLSSMCPMRSDIFWELIQASEIEWYMSNSPDKVQGFVDSLMRFYAKIKNNS